MAISNIAYKNGKVFFESYPIGKSRYNFTKSRVFKKTQNKKGQKIFPVAQFSVSFSQLPAVKKATIFGAAQTKLGPSYFVRALEFDCCVTLESIK